MAKTRTNSQNPEEYKELVRRAHDFWGKSGLLTELPAEEVAKQMRFSYQKLLWEAARSGDKRTFCVALQNAAHTAIDNHIESFRPSFSDTIVIGEDPPRKSPYWLAEHVIKPKQPATSEAAKPGEHKGRS